MNLIESEKWVFFVLKKTADVISLNFTSRK